jgi:large subunit ribosomal protein L7/L12
VELGHRGSYPFPNKFFFFAGVAHSAMRPQKGRKTTMSDSETATLEFSDETKGLGDKIAALTLKDAKQLSEYLKEEYQIEPAAGGAVIMQGGDGGGAEEEVVQTEFDVVLTGYGDKKLNVVKLVKAMTGGSLMDSKKLVESAPAVIKEGLPTEEAEKMKAELEEAGASIELK